MRICLRHGELERVGKDVVVAYVKVTCHYLKKVSKIVRSAIETFCMQSGHYSNSTKTLEVYRFTFFLL